MREVLNEGFEKEGGVKLRALKIEVLHSLPVGLVS
jgi:hypothetical protein